MIYSGLFISLWGVALIALAVWLPDFGLPMRLLGLLLGSAFVYGGWLLTERGH
jgi:hypothetical protein